MAEKIPFRGPVSLAVRLSRCAGCIAELRGNLYKCVLTSWTQDPQGPGIVGHVLFYLVWERGNSPAFPADLLAELLTNHARQPTGTDRP